MMAQQRRIVLSPRTLICGLLLVLAPSLGRAQFYPTEPPTEIFSDDFSAATIDAVPPDWTAMRWTGSSSFVGNWRARADTIGCAKQGVWETHVRDNRGRSTRQSVLVVDQSMAATPDWTNIRVEFDFKPNARAAPGVVFGGQDTDGDGQLDDGYLFYIDSFPTWNEAVNLGARATWHLVKRTAGADAEVASDIVELDASVNALLTMYRTCYRLRLEFFCGNLRVQARRFRCNDSGCSEWDCGGEWCTIMEWTDDSGSVLTPGSVGLFAGGTQPSSNGTSRYDNVVVSSWGTDCHQLCDPWDGWDEVSRDSLQLKYLYEGAYLDYSAGRDVPRRQIDVATIPPTTSSARNTTTTNFCNGWKQLVDLPAPLAAVDNLAAIRAFLQPMATAVNLVNDGTGTLSWSDDFDNDPASATYNPVPIVTDGATPIANSLYDAYEWYVDIRTNGAWADDPLAECRLWYVVLITDGEESCAGGVLDQACQTGEAAELFAAPAAGLDAVPVYTIGFSEGVAADSPLRCVADITGGQFLSANNASELSDALYEVVNAIVESNRSFIPFKVSPPPSSAGSPSGVQDFLALYPFFIPRNSRSLWDGTIYAFKLNRDQPEIPTTGGCDIDFTQVAWDADAALETQLSGTPTRYVFMGSDVTSSWVRHDLATIPANATLRTEFKTRLNVTGGVTDVQAQEVVNFVRNFWVDNDTGASPDPQANARPAGWSALGDIYHSQPVIVSPPATAMFQYDFGFADNSGAHGYRDFMEEQEKRRRVALAGANDGMLHAFDAGFFDRDDGGTYDDLHDLGDGTELFAYVPQSVMRRLYGMTYGEEHQYMVDGPIAAGDVFIDHDGDSSREWRTVALATMRRGGRGVVALDITQPDPTSGSPNFTPTETDFPGCLAGTAAGCAGAYPRLMWEFSDTQDVDDGCALDEADATYLDNCAPYFDLGWTWSKPTIARIAIYNAVTPSEPDDIFVAFFGGGWDRSGTDATGNFFYGVNIETGEIVYKNNIAVAVPGSPFALDADIDGFHERIYFADSDGSVWRMSFPAPNVAASAATIPTADPQIPTPTLTRIYDFRSDFTDRQQFFLQPIVVPALFDGGTFTYGLALGSGNRAELEEELGYVDHFFFLLDVGDSTTRGAADLRAIGIGDLTGAFDCASSALSPSDGSFGWYLTLNDNEKVNFEASVVNGLVRFPTFEPGENLTADHNPPDVCGEPDPELPPSDALCKASGLGRIYELNFECGLGDYIESNTPFSGSETYTIDGITRTTFTTFDDSEGEEFTDTSGMGHVVTNWRQE